MQEIFLILAKEEAEHKKTFEKMLADLSPKERRNTDQISQEGQDYIQNLLNETEVVSFSETADATNIQRAINVAIAGEKQSILFYLSIKIFLPDAQKKLLEGIINLENMHIMKLHNIQQLFDIRG